MQGFICGPRLYEFDGWFFEDHASSGPWPLKKDGDLRSRAGNVFYTMYENFSKLTPKEKLKYRVGGGCIPLLRIDKH